MLIGIWRQAEFGQKRPFILASGKVRFRIKKRAVFTTGLDYRSGPEETFALIYRRTKNLRVVSADLKQLPTNLARIMLTSAIIFVDF